MKRPASVMATVILAAIAAIFPFTQGASATTVYEGQYCYSDGNVWACLNAWNGGPWVRVYENVGTTNNNFEIMETPNNFWVIQYFGKGNPNGGCVGDAYNQSGRADASLDPCGSGWGTNFILVPNPPGGGKFAFYNNHWRGWLCPSNNYNNGTPFYLNSNQECGFYAFNLA